MRLRLCRLAAALALFGTPVVAVAQVIPPSDLPGRERERFIDPQPARAQPRGTVINLPSTVAPQGAESIRLVVSAVRITGMTVYSEGDIASLYADLVGREVPLQAVYDLAQRITAKYGQDGYVLSRAIVPPQNLNPGGAVIRIQVLEGYVDKVIWPEKLARYRDFFTEYEAKIVAERPINVRTLERYLLLLGDLPGFKVSTTLKPSTTQLAASTLVVDVTEKPLDLLGRADNFGSRARGPEQFLGSATVNNILGVHEAFNVTYAGAFQLRELQYAAASYRQVLNSEGFTVFANASYSWGKPGTPELELLNYKTRTTYAEAGWYYPLVRSREKNLTITGLGFITNSDGVIFDDPDTPPSTRDRLRGFRLKADADYADPLRGINQFNVTLSQGIDGFDSTNNGNPLASRANGRVDFTKLEFTYARLQPLFWNLSAYGSLYGQYAFDPLLSPELCSYGGRFYGRAYDASALVGDRCWLALGELRLDLPVPSTLLSLAQLYGFIDHGHLSIIRPQAGTLDRIDAGSAGAGIRFGWNNQLFADVAVAKAIDGPIDDTRFRFTVSARN
jgi:hemolysin activation/secretion protein